MTAMLWLAALALACGALFGLFALAAPRQRDLGPLMIPCEACALPTWIRVAHTHHHAPGCGIDDPNVESCRCDFYLCAGCCPCEVTVLDLDREEAIR